MWNFFWTLQLETGLRFWVRHWGKFTSSSFMTPSRPWVDTLTFRHWHSFGCETEACWSGVTEDWSQLFRRTDFTMWNERIHFNAGLIRFGFIILQTTFALGVLNYCKMWWPRLFQVKTFQPVLPAGIFWPSTITCHSRQSATLISSCGSSALPSAARLLNDGDLRIHEANTRSCVLKRNWAKKSESDQREASQSSAD